MDALKLAHPFIKGFDNVYYCLSEEEAQAVTRGEIPEALAKRSKEDIEGKDVAVVLSELDQIVDAKEVRRYLTDEETDEPEFHWQKDNLHVLWYEDIDHAQVFDTKTRRSPLISILQSFAERRLLLN